MRPRFELIGRPRPDGGLDLYDPLLERLHRLSPDEAAAYAAGRYPLDEALLAEGPLADLLRAQVIDRHARPWPDPAPGEAGPLDLAAAIDLSDHFAPRWRAPEPWRRLAEDRRAGAALLRLDGLLSPAGLAALDAALAPLPFARLDTAVVRAARQRLDAPPFLGPALTHLCGQLLGRALPAAFLGNAWTLGPGDAMAIHPDGPRYAGTLAIGLSAGWTAAQGGAIAFGDPSPHGLQVRQRWLPQAGDALLFAPTATTFHAVEPVIFGQRRSFTGWWTA